MNDFDLYFRYASNTDYLTTDDLLLFLEAEQGVRSEESFPKHRIQMNFKVLSPREVKMQMSLEFSVKFSEGVNTKWFNVQLIRGQQEVTATRGTLCTRLHYPPGVNRVHACIWFEIQIMAWMTVDQDVCDSNCWPQRHALH